MPPLQERMKERLIPLTDSRSSAKRATYLSSTTRTENNASMRIKSKTLRGVDRLRELLSFY